jgi:hypothetical protein
LINKQHGKRAYPLRGKVGDTVLEVYLLPPGRMPDATTRLGFSVANLVAVLEGLSDTGAVVGSQRRRSGECG